MTLPGTYLDKSRGDVLGTVYRVLCKCFMNLIMPQSYEMDLKGLWYVRFAMSQSKRVASLNLCLVYPNARISTSF